MEDWQLEFSDAESMFEEVKRLRKKLSKQLLVVPPVNIDNHEGQWASIYTEDGGLKDVICYAKGKKMAETLLLSTYADEFKKLISVIPVSIQSFATEE
jgi:hypothetical protein